MEIQKRRHSYKMVKIVIALVLMLGIFLRKNEAVSVKALETVFTGECGDSLTWKLYDGTLTISGSGEMQDYYYNNMPWYDNIKGIKMISFEKGITKIGNYAFYGCTELEKITLPETVKAIGDYTYGDCSGLKTVVLPESTEHIGYCAFAGCTALKEISIPKKVKEIGGYIFSGDKNLEKVDFHDNTEKIRDTDGNMVPFSLKIGSCAFCNCEKLKSLGLPVQTKELGSQMLAGSGVEKFLIRKGISKANGALVGANCLEKLEFESGTEKIPDSLCYVDAYRYGCKNLTEIVLPESITEIGYDAFYDCRAVEKVTLPSGMEKVGAGAFYGCISLKEINMPKNVKEIGSNAFSGDKNLEKVDFHDNTEKIRDTDGSMVPFSLKIGSFAFGDCEKVKSLELPVQTKELGSRMLAGSGVEKFLIRKGISKANGALVGANCLEKLEFESGTEKIPDSLYYESAYRYGCENLTEIVLPESITEIGYDAFYNCINLKEINIPKNVKEIGSNAFSGDKNLEKVSFQDNTEKIRDTDGSMVPFSLKIGSFAFGDCEKLKSLELPVQTKELGSQMLAGSGVEKFLIRKGISKANGALVGANCLEKLEFESGTEKIPDGLCYVDAYRYGCKNLTEIVLPESITEIGYDAFYDCRAVEKVTLPSGMEKVGAGAFYGCISLKEINIPKNVKEIGSNAFSGDKNLENVDFQDNTEKIRDTDGSMVPFSLKIGSFAFGDCEKLKSLELPVQTKELGSRMLAGSGVEKFLIRKGISKANGALVGANCLEKLEFESGTEKIPDSLCYVDAYRYGCKNLTEIVLPESVKEIGYDAFYDCIALERIILPFNVEIIGNSAFAYCVNLKEIYFSGNAPTIGKNTFSEITITAYRPNNNATWTNEKLQNYGGSITWASWDPQIDSNRTTTLNIKFVNTGGTTIDGSKVYASWKEGYGYSPSEINAEITITYYPTIRSSVAKLNEVILSTENLDMYKIDGKEKRTIGIELTYGQKYSFTVKLVKKGLFWKKLNPGTTEVGSINAYVKGVFPNTTLTPSAFGEIEVSNPIIEEPVIPSEEDKSLEKELESEAEKAVAAFDDISSKITLDPQLDRYFGNNVARALEVLVYSEISLTNMSKSKWKEASLSDRVVEKIMDKYLGDWKPKIGTAVKNVPISVIINTGESGRIECDFLCRLNSFTLKDTIFGTMGSIETTLVFLDRNNQTLKLTNGILADTDIKKFTDAAWGVASAELKKGFNDVWGNDANKIANRIISSKVESLANKAAPYGLKKPVEKILEKFYEKKLKSKFSEGVFNILVYPSKTVQIKCPVDVYVYNENNELVGSIENDEITRDCDEIILWTEGDEKYVQLFNTDYHLEYKATGTGTMTVNVYDQTDGLSDIRKCSYTEIPLEAGLGYQQSINDKMLTSETNYNLISDNGKVITISEMECYDEVCDNNTIDVKAGDLNQDGEISNTDVVTLARNLAGLTGLKTEQLAAADVNHDGSVDNADLVMLARAVAGLTVLK